MALRKFKVKLHHRKECPYPHDVERIKNAMRNAGWDVSSDEAKSLWELYSESMAAGWIILPKEDESIVYTLERFIEPIDDSCPRCHGTSKKTYSCDHEWHHTGVCPRCWSTDKSIRRDVQYGPRDGPHVEVCDDKWHV